MAEPNDCFVDEMVALGPQLRRRALSLCRNPACAEDLVQETYLRAWRNRRSFAEGTCLSAWLMTILRNAFLADRRRARTARDARDRLTASPTSATSPQLAALQLRETADNVLALPQCQRRALLMVALGVESYEEAASKLACSVGTIKSRVSRARGRLRQLAETA